MSLWKDRPLELYLHIPFCRQKCAYCDFLSGPWDEETQEQYVNVLVQEMQHVSEEAAGRKVSTIFVGGGTPSLLRPSLMQKIFEQAHKNFQVAPDAEITIEANPGTLHREQLQCYRELGINRLSMGLQSTVEKELNMLGRIHTFPDFLKNYENAREIGFDNISVDLMFALPDQTRTSWQETLQRTAELSPEHLSAYSLIIEEGTPFASMKLSLPEEDTEYAMYEDTAEILSEYGFHQYEISNYAKPGRESRHNLGYWERKDYLGFGIGAASLWTPAYEGEKQAYPTQIRFANTRNMGTYLKEQGNPENIREDKEYLTKEDAIAEFMFLGLRKTAGISKTEFRKEFGTSVEEIYGEIIRKYCSMGLLEETGDQIRLTRAGIHVSNSVMAEFLL